MTWEDVLRFKNPLAHPTGGAQLGAGGDLGGGGIAGGKGDPPESPPDQPGSDFDRIESYSLTALQIWIGIQLEAL